MSIENRENVPKGPSRKEAFPVLSEADHQILRKQLPQVRQDIAKLEGHYDNLKKNYPDVFADLAKKHPSLSMNIERAHSLADFIGVSNPRVSDAEMLQALDDYNFFARQINDLFGKVKRDQEEQGEGEIGLDDMGINESEYNESQKAELKAFAQDLWKEFFPESNVDYFVRWATGQKKLEGYQKILLAPANGIEAALGGLISLFKPKTYQDLYASIETVYKMDKTAFTDLLRGMRYDYDQLTATDKVAPAIQLIYGFAFLSGGVSKLGQMAGKLGYAPTLVKGLQGVRGVSAASRGLQAMGKAAPMAAIAGIVLPYIKVKEV